MHELHRRNELFGDATGLCLVETALLLYTLQQFTALHEFHDDIGVQLQSVNNKSSQVNDQDAHWARTIIIIYHESKDGFCSLGQYKQVKRTAWRQTVSESGEWNIGFFSYLILHLLHEVYNVTVALAQAQDLQLPTGIDSVRMYRKIKDSTSMRLRQAER